MHLTPAYLTYESSRVLTTTQTQYLHNLILSHLTAHHLSCRDENLLKSTPCVSSSTSLLSLSHYIFSCSYHIFSIRSFNNLTIVNSRTFHSSLKLTCFTNPSQCRLSFSGMTALWTLHGGLNYAYHFIFCLEQ